ncbi:18120_t:CDS:10, partial [Entrophospora sp. SA101]
NENVGFDEVDLEEDFNPEKYDDKMQKIFDEEFYNKQASDDEYLDEYYQLNYEDIIDDTPVRFKYNKVKSTSFGLTPTEILLADEKDLNEFVSLKKYAPYRPDNVVEKDLKKYSKKKRLREFLFAPLNSGEKGEKKFFDDGFKNIILGIDHSHHAKSKKKEVRRRKKAVKALQNHVTAQRMISILKAMPEPDSPLVTSIGVEIDKNDSIKNLSGSDTTSSATIPLSKDTEQSLKLIFAPLNSGEKGEKKFFDDGFKNIILGIDHSHHAKSKKKEVRRRKKAVKALQNHVTAQRMISILKAMPEPDSPLVTSIGVEIDKNDSIKNLSGSDTTSSATIPLSKDTVYVKNKENDEKELMSGRTITKTSSIKDGSKIVVSSSTSTTDVTITTTIKANSLKTNSTNKDKIIKPSLNTISCYVYWWGYEVYVPQKCMGRLDQAQNVSNSFLGLLHIVVGNSSPISPYFGLISAWVGLQFTLIKSKTVDNGVIKMDLDDEPVEFKINHQYAKKYEIRKRGEELSK